MANPNQSKRDPIDEETPSAKASVKRSDTLNGSPKTRSIAGGKPNYSSFDDKSSAPPPNNPYK